jgi:hypothetical protein
MLGFEPLGSMPVSIPDLDQTETTEPVTTSGGPIAYPAADRVVST